MVRLVEVVLKPGKRACPPPCNDWHLRSGQPAPATPGLGTQLLHQLEGRHSRFGLLKDADGNPSNGSQFHAYNRRTGKVDLITGSDWETYQKEEGGYSPPFAEYTSGHSTFSAAGAEFLKRFTGSKAFGGKVAFDLSFEFPNGGSTELQWKTWQEAALDAGRSRLWGGIHFPDGNRQGLKVGDKIGSAVHHNLSQLWG